MENVHWGPLDDSRMENGKLGMGNWEWGLGIGELNQNISVWLLHHVLQFRIFYLVFLTVARQNWFKLVKQIQSVIASYFAISDFLFGIPHSCQGKQV